MSKLARQLILENIQKHQRGEDARRLDLGDCDMINVPKAIGDLVWLEELNLSHEWYEYDLEKKEWVYRASQNKGGKNWLKNLPSTLSRLTLLKKIICSDSQISNLRPLAGLKNLELLYGRYTQIRKLGPLAGLTNLQQLFCDNTQVRGLRPLAGLTNLQLLNCGYTQVSDLRPLAGLTSLQHLNCDSTPVSDLGPLAGLTSLQQLYCGYTQVSDLSPLIGLTDLQELRFDKTQVSDLSPLVGLTNLQRLSCDNTQVSDLSPLAGLTNLQTLRCGKTPVSDLSPLLSLIRTGRQVKWCKYEGDIQVEDCPLVNPPVEIAKQGNEAILRYFEEQEKRGENPLLEPEPVVVKSKWRW